MSQAHPSDAPPAEPVAPAPAPQYEFTEEQNAVIDRLARAILWVRAPLLVTGVLQLILALGLALRLSRDGAHIVGVIGYALSAVVSLLLAYWLLRAALAFFRITTTEGRDITHLMEALGYLGSWFDLLAFFVKLYLFLLGLLLAVLGVGLLTGAFQEPG